jgi:predicted deacylase
VFFCRGASTRPLAVVVAGVHGDEYEGPAAVARLSACLEARAMQGSVIAIPVANPLAFAVAQQLTPDDGLNLARTFPGKPAGSPTERLAAWLFENVVRGADYLIDLHSGGVEYRFLPLAGFYGPAERSDRSYRAARHFGLPVLWQLPETPGVLSLEAWRIGIVAIGCEYLGGGQLSAQGVSCYADGVLSCLALWGLLDQARRKPESGQVLRGGWQLAEASGLFRYYCELGERVEAGRVLAEIVDLRGATLQSFIASEPGVILALRSKAYTRKGDWGVLVASE